VYAYSGSCAGEVINPNHRPVRVNEATLAVNMTTYIFNTCILKGMYGKYVTSEIAALLYPTPSSDAGKLKIEDKGQ
jgi:hypothetical protein